MRIAVASGKGGAGKTMVSSGLVEVWDRPVVAVDTDVEAPNLHLFLNPEILASEKVLMEVPEIQPETCIMCGACRDVCQFKAIAKLGKSLKIFPEMCHGCGACFAVCPVQALLVSHRELGDLQEGYALEGRVPFLMGKARIGEALTPPQIKKLLARMEALVAPCATSAPSLQPADAGLSSTEKSVSLVPGADAIMDSPPGVSCPAMVVGRKADVILLVAEPTPFGFHDFRLAHEAFSSLGKPVAVVMNRVGIPENSAGDEAMRQYCRDKGLSVLAEFPFEREVATAYSHRQIISSLSAEWRTRFEGLRDAVKLMGASHA